MNPQDPKSHGTTASERYLSNLARKSFLSIWSYPNLYTDEGRRANKGAGKELCDLLVVFGSSILIFSDKHCDFPDHENPQIAWTRWFKRAIMKSVNQVLGAEKWIRRFPDRIFLDPHCSIPIPIDMPNHAQVKYFRIAVTRGSYDACRLKLKQGLQSGSFLIDTSIRGKEHFKYPFHMGSVNEGPEFIHVLDELTLDILLRVLDTISDFVEYLIARESLLSRSRPTVIAMGEEDIIAQPSPWR